MYFMIIFFKLNYIIVYEQQVIRKLKSIFFQCTLKSKYLKPK